MGGGDWRGPVEGGTKGSSNDWVITRGENLLESYSCKRKQFVMKKIFTRNQKFFLQLQLLSCIFNFLSMLFETSLTVSFLAVQSN